jgi:hypothetical protein
MLEVKPEVSCRPSFVSVSEDIYIQLVCYSTAQYTTKLEIEWVDCLTQHLELDVTRRTLKLFRYPSYCRMMCHKQNIHRQYLTPSRIESSSC